MSVVATLSGVLRLDDSDFRSGMRGAKDEMNSFGDRMRSVGDNVRDFGTRMTIATAPIAAYLGTAVTSAQNYERALANVNSIIQVSDTELQSWSATIREIGSQSIFGSQQSVEASYAIVSAGITDQADALGLLNTATNLAESGQANLLGTTNALIGAMNAYQFTVDDQAYISDVYARVVQTGVGSLDDLGDAVTNTLTLGKTYNQDFAKMAAATSFLTTRNIEASEAGTLVNAMMTTLLNPTADLEAAITGLGYSSGRTLLETEGLVGAYQLLSEQNNGLDGLITNNEALRGASILTQEAASDFINTFVEGIPGATEKMKEAQEGTETFLLLKSALGDLSITIGQVFLPALSNMVDQYITPIVHAFNDWLGQNPELASGIAMFTGALVVAGPIITAIGIAIGFLASPIGLLTALVGGAIAYFGDFGAIMSALQGIFMRFQVSGLTDGFTLLFTTFEDGSSHISDLLQAFGLSEEMSNNVANTINQVLVPALVGIWTNAQESLGALFSWFMETGLPAIQGFITDTVVPGVQSFIDTLVRIWNDVSPTLTLLFDWFMTTGLPMMVDYVNVTFVPAIESIVNIMTGIWDAVSPYLGQLYDWFVTTGLPAIGDYITGPFTTAFQGLIDFIGSIWEVVQPGLQAFQDGIGGVFTWIMDNAIGPVSGALATAGSWINGATTWTGNALSTAGDFISNNNPFAPTQLGGTGQGRAAGGEVNPNAAYMVGETGPEVFVPSVPGEIMNQDQMNGMGGGIHVTVQQIIANSYAEGQAAARGLYDELNELSRGRGIRAGG